MCQTKVLTPVAGVWDSRLLARTYFSLGVPEAMAIPAIKFMPAIWSSMQFIVNSDVFYKVVVVCMMNC
jgi:hypothetical protein